MNNKKPETYLPEKIKKFKPYMVVRDDNIKIRLDANESFYKLTPAIKNEIKKAVTNFDFNRYPDPFAQKVIEKYADYIKCDPKNITAGNGSDEIINIIINTFTSKGDKILTFAPDFVMYSFYGDIIEAGIDVIVKDPEKDFHLDFEKIKKFVSKNKIKLVFFSNPCNPTGQIENRAEIEDFISSIDAVVILDEVYMPFCGNAKRETFIYDIERHTNLIILKSLSKSIGLAAIRLGFAVTNEIFADTLKMMKSPYNVNAFTQKIGEIVLSHTDFLEKEQRIIINNKNDLNQKIKKLLTDENFKIFETHTNFVFIKTSEAGKIYEYLYSKGILVKNIKNEYLRITTGDKTENEILLEQLRAYMSERSGG